MADPSCEPLSATLKLLQSVRLRTADVWPNNITGSCENSSVPLLGKNLYLQKKILCHSSNHKKSYKKIYFACISIICGFYYTFKFFLSKTISSKSKNVCFGKKQLNIYLKICIMSYKKVRLYYFYFLANIALHQ